MKYLDFWFKTEPPGEIIKRSFHEKTVNLSITLPADMLQQITGWGLHHGIISRSLSIQWFIYQGIVRIQEIEAEYRIAEEERVKKERLERLKEDAEKKEG